MTVEIIHGDARDNHGALISQRAADAAESGGSRPIVAKREADAQGCLMQFNSSDIAHLISRAESLAECSLIVALHTPMTPPPRLQVQLQKDSHRIDVAVEHDGRRLAVIIGRTGEHRTEGDNAMDEALKRAGWPVYRLPADRVVTRPMQAVADVLAALRTSGAAVERTAPATRRVPLSTAETAAEGRSVVEMLGGKRVA